MKTNSNLSAEVEQEHYAIFDVRALYEVVRKRVWLVAVCALIGLALGAGLAMMRQDIYEVTAAVQVEEESPLVVGIEDVTKETYRLPEELKTVEQELVTRNLIWRVIQTNKIDKIPGFFKPGLLQKMQGKELSQSDMIDALVKNFTVKLRRGTRLIDITVSHEDPQMAQTLASSLIEQSLSQNAEWRVSPSKDANKVLVDEAERLKKTVERSEQALEDYREKNHAVSLDDKQNIIVERLKDLNLRVARAQNDTLALESDVAQIEKLGRQPEKLLAIGSIANSLSVLDAQRVSMTKEGAFAVLRQRYGPENPAFAQAERELHQVRAALDAAVLNAADSLRSRYESAKFSQQTSEQMLKEQELVALDLNKKATQYAALSRDLEADRELYASVVKRLKEMSVIQNINKMHLRVVEPPMPPGTPSWRGKLILAAMGLFGGAALGLVIGVGRFVTRPSIQSPDHAGRALGLPTLGAIPRIPRLKDVSRFPGIADPLSKTAEAFRFFAASTATLLGAGGKGSLLLTAATSGDGTTSCAAGYAVALAKSGVRTLLIDADFRNPELARLFATPKGSSGLADCLAGRSTLDDAVLPTKVDNLFVLVAGTAPAEISSLFSGPAFGDLIASAAEAFGQVVIDSAPATVASETLLIARHASVTCLVLRSGDTSISAASRACQLLDGVGRLPVGSILNRVPRRMIS